MAGFYLPFAGQVSLSEIKARVPAAAAVARTGVMLIGLALLPFGLMDNGVERIDVTAHAAGKAWAMVAVSVGAVCTGGALLIGHHVACIAVGVALFTLAFAVA